MRPIYTGTIKPTPPEADGRLNAPAAIRNLEPILALLRDHMPAAGHAVEIASGTGQHCAAFAEAFPGLKWQPTDVVPERLASIDAWAEVAGVANMAPAATLNVEQAEWPFAGGSANVLMLVNLLHLVSDSAAEAVFKGAKRLLAPGGRFFVYGPFLRDGEFVSESDASFHDSLRQQDQAIGYKDADGITQLAGSFGFVLLERRDMPANNLMFAFEKQPGG
jgi:SAM-dependent methyltransferase